MVYFTVSPKAVRVEEANDGITSNKAKFTNQQPSKYDFDSLGTKLACDS